MNNIYTNNDNKSMFPIGYPKRIFFKHIVPPKINKDNFNNIISVRPAYVEFWKIVSSQLEENKLLNKKKISNPIEQDEPIYSKPVLSRSGSSRSF